MTTDVKASEAPASDHARDAGPWDDAALAALREWDPIWAGQCLKMSQSALKLGATMEQVTEVLKICVAAGLQASSLGVPILADELTRAGR